MKIKATKSAGIYHAGAHVEIVAGQSHDVPDEVAQLAIKQGWAESHPSDDDGDETAEPSSSDDDVETGAPARKKAASRKAPETS